MCAALRMSTSQPAAVLTCECIRSTIKRHGVDIDVSAVVRDRSGQRVVRLRARDGSGINRIVEALTRMAPLAHVAALTSDVDGSDEVELRLPNQRNLTRKAFTTAKSGYVPWLLWKLGTSIILVAVALAMSVFVQNNERAI